MNSIDEYRGANYIIKEKLISVASRVYWAGSDEYKDILDLRIEDGVTYESEELLILIKKHDSNIFKMDIVYKNTRMY